MSQRIFLFVLVFCSLLLFNSCKTTKPTVSKPSETTKPEIKDTLPSSEKVSPPPPPAIPEVVEEKTLKSEAPLKIAEFRAAWVTSVANINWPSQRNLTTSQQQQEALEILDFLEEHNFNAVILQVRPQADALYESDLEPWSYFLTGETGKAPQPYYDPLKFWTEAAHNRGMELHVWLNPYRAYHTTGGEISEKSLVKTRPELMTKLKNGFWWMDPAKQGTQDHVAAVVMDIVQRYDIDGVHFDDYFYPYASYNGKQQFPDNISWEKYKTEGGKLLRDDWRRDNVNKFVKRIYSEIKAEKPHVKFGISPFGIWRPGHPASIKGMDQYSELYADAKLWLNEGWIDYFTPQLYWKINQVAQSFPVLLSWWKDENTENRHLWPGINDALIGEEEKKDTDEITNQLMITRGILDSRGAVHWNVGPIMKNSELAHALKEGPYRKKALVPASPWLDDEAPKAPKLNISKFEDKLALTWEHPDPEDVFRWVLYFKYENSGWDYKILNQNERNFTLHNARNFTKIGITAVDRTGNESNFKEIVLQ
ncbi:glycoside hydrolase family 10 protein [Autumnicola edwardsiae]|uniref:Family 10 glycosylhydrolase n=1 Tax=Autumnicola edwardsiae TaxID=3075594 RepID=A0ABU3CX26_9FLAO|nr:family 10 glycosylhydrolase [Zunongwangia sp. F297]MDT0650918.1 family 10 glycosylhydrolase [Zunongwangia sp. F297]